MEPERDEIKPIDGMLCLHFFFLLTNKSQFSDMNANSNADDDEVLEIMEVRETEVPVEEFAPPIISDSDENVSVSDAQM